MSEHIKQTATELLMNVLEDFGLEEPEDAMVIWTNQKGGLSFLTTTNSLTRQIGLIEFVRERVRSNMVRGWDGK